MNHDFTTMSTEQLLALRKKATGLAAIGELLDQGLCRGDCDNCPVWYFENSMITFDDQTPPKVDGCPIGDTTYLLQDCSDIDELIARIDTELRNRQEATDAVRV